MIGYDVQWPSVHAELVLTECELFSELRWCSEAALRTSSRSGPSLQSLSTLASFPLSRRYYEQTHINRVCLNRFIDFFDYSFTMCYWKCAWHTCPRFITPYGHYRGYIIGGKYPTGQRLSTGCFKSQIWSGHEAVIILKWQNCPK